MSSPRASGMGAGVAVAVIFLAALVGFPIGQLLIPVIMLLILAIAAAIMVGASKAKETLTSWAMGLGGIVIIFPVICMVLEEHWAKVMFILFVLVLMGLVILFAKIRYARSKDCGADQRPLSWTRTRLIEPEQSSIEPWREHHDHHDHHVGLGDDHDSDDDLDLFGSWRG